jgi:hypothetical protein
MLFSTLEIKYLDKIPFMLYIGNTNKNLQQLFYTFHSKLLEFLLGNACITFSPFHIKRTVTLSSGCDPHGCEIFL